MSNERENCMKQSPLRITALAFLGVLAMSPAFGQGAATILGQTPLPVQPASLMSSSSQGTNFGSAVALDQNLLVVGAPEEECTTPCSPCACSNTGGVYVFVRQGADWIETQRLTAQTETAFEEFGHSVDVARGDDGTDFLVVGVPLADSSRGRVDVFKRLDAGPWQFETTLSQVDAEPGDRFGEDVAIDFFQPPNDPGATGPVFVIAAGAPNNDGPEVSDTDNGSVSIFQRAGGPPTWGPVGQEFFGEDNSDLLGSSVAMSGPWIVAGAPGLDATPSGPGFNSGGGVEFSQGNFGGTVYFYAQGKELLPTDGQLFAAGMGLSAAVHGSAGFPETGVLGAPLHDQGAFNAGKVYIYDLTTATGTSLTESATLQPSGLSSSAEFGASIDLSAGVLAVGAPGMAPDGAVFLYERGATVADWSPAGQLTIPNQLPAENCRGGEAVTLQGVTLAAGCPSSGSLLNDWVYVFFGGIFADGFESGFGVWTSAVP